MKSKLSKFWAWFAVLIPILVGFAFMFNSSQLMPEGTEVADVARTVGLRNIALSIPLLIAILWRNWKAVGLLLLARGLSDLGDGISMIWGKGSFEGTDIGAFVIAALSFAAAYYFLKDNDSINNLNASAV